MVVLRGLVVALWLGAAGAAQETAKAALPLGIFGVGFTNVTNTSARLVFTTSEPVAASVEVFDGAASVLKVDGGAGEIHAVALSGLRSRGELKVVVTVKEASAEATLTLGQRAASKHVWPGYTIFSSTTQGKDTPETMDLLVQSGVKMVRIEPSWDGVYPKRGELNQAFVDRFVTRVKDLQAHGMEPLVILDYSVAWGMRYTHTTMTWRNKNFGAPDDLADWKEYVRTIVTALRDGAKHYEIWNEPDAGYLATGSYVERPELPAPIGRPPFKDNTSYWIGDRYVPMVEAARGVIDELEPGAIVMNGGWNRDYTGSRGDVMLQRGAGPYLDAYAYHVYSHAPASFGRWFTEVDGGFRANIDRIFQKNHVTMPLAVTEWGWPAWTTAPEGKGFGSFVDSQLFYLKSTLYFLSMERFELLSQFSLGVGPGTREKDPLFFMLVNTDDTGKFAITPTYNTFKWLATTFGSKPYRAVTVATGGEPGVKAYAIQMKDSGDIYLAAWQDGDVDEKGAVSPRPARTVPLVIEDAAAGKYRLDVLTVNGQVRLSSMVGSKAGLGIVAPLPGAGSVAESGVYLVRLSAVVGKAKKE